MTNIFGPTCCPAGIRGYGDPTHGVVIVGIAPGADEISSTKRPFTGDSGQLMDKLLLFAGWDRDKTYCTNVICWKNNVPNAEQQDVCRERFQRELRLMKPRLIITAGAIPSEAVTGHKRRKGARGTCLWSDHWNAYILDTHHPSAVLQAQSMSFAQDIIRDFGKISEILSWAPGAPHARVNYSVCESIADFQKVLDNLPRDGRTVSLDIETSNPEIEDMDPYSDKLVTLAISYDALDGAEYNVVLPTRAIPACIRDGTHAKAKRKGQPCQNPSCGVGSYHSELVWPVEDVRWTFQAGQGDVAGIYQAFNARLPMRDDTMLMSYCTDERPGYHNLKSNGREWLGLGWWEEKTEALKKKGRIDEAKPEDVEEYNAVDAAAQKRLVNVFTPKMREDGTEDLYRNLLLPAVDTFVSSQIRGINVDQKRLQELAYDNWFPKYIADERELQLEAVELGWPTDDFNTESNKQMRKMFYGHLSMTPSKFSKKTGAPSVDKEVLDRMDHPFATKIRAWRTLDTTVGYVIAVMTHLKSDGFLHPSAYVSTTRNGRTSYRNPAMQTIPKDYTVGADYARLREIIIPHNPETHIIGEWDYSQAEVWMAWFRSQDSVLYQHLTSGDVHSRTAEGAFNTKQELHSYDEWQILRQNAKKIRFGLGYGEGADGLSRPPPVGIGGSKAAAQKFIDNFWKTYNVHRAWNDRTQRQIYTDGYLRSASGRVMRFPLVLDHKALRQAINFPISADASDYNLSSMVELFHPEDLFEACVELRKLNAHLLLNVHDYLAVEIDRRYIPETVNLVRDIMQKPRFPGYPSLKVDVKIGDNLGNVKKYAE